MQQTFDNFCGGRCGMDGKGYAKLCKDSGLIDKKFTSIDADLIFAKTCPKGERRIDFDQFCASLQLVAAKSGRSVDAITQMIGSVSGPVLIGTQADSVRFHDDKTTYTGTHVNGSPEAGSSGDGLVTQLASTKMVIMPPPGRRMSEPAPRPRVADEQVVRTMSADRQPCVTIPFEDFERICWELTTNKLLGAHAAQALRDAAGISSLPSLVEGKKPKELRLKVAETRDVGITSDADDLETRTPSSSRRSLSPSVSPQTSLNMQERRPSLQAPPVGRRPSSASKRPSSASPRIPSKPHMMTGTVEETFYKFADHNSGMDQKTFAKLCKDCQLVDKAFTTNDADIVFAKVVTKGQRRINVPQFTCALGHVAEKKEMDTDVVLEAVLSLNGPRLNGTVADRVRFHDDKSTYTGTHVNGGPASVAVGHGTATQLASKGMALG